MENNSVSKYSVSFGLSLALCSVLNALLVVAKEKIPSVQTEMQKLTGNQWVTHAAVIILLFVFFGWLLAKVNGGRGSAMAVNSLIKIIVAGILSASVIITGFYLIVG